MPSELPIACTLGADDLEQRLAAMADLGRVLLHAARESNEATLRFAAGGSVRDRLEAVVAAEASCCAFLTMRLADEPGEIVLTISAPEGAELVLEELVGAFQGDTLAR